MKRHRVFIAINPPEKVKNQLYRLKDEFFDLPGRFTKKDSLHLTLVFLGYLSDEQIMEIISGLKKIAARQTSFDLVFNRVAYGPPGKRPRLVWAGGPGCEELTLLKNKLDEFLTEAGQQKFRQKKFLPHVTLMRLKNQEGKDLPEIKEGLRISFPVTSFELMESELKKDGAEYHILESFPFDL